MRSKARWPSFLTRAALSLALLGSYASASERGDLLSLGTIDEKEPSIFLDAFMKEVAKRKQDIKNFGLLTTFKEAFQNQMSKGVARSRVFTYASEDSHGPSGPAHKRVYSGRVFLPPHPESPKIPFKTPLSVPIVLYQHATETRSNFVPSINWGGEETLFGAMAASMGGFVVVMPDGDGMGLDKDEMHHYCFGETAGKSVVDCLQAIISGGEITDKNGTRMDGVFDNVNYVWDRRVFIVGYSEGGYIAMAGVKELSRKDGKGNYVYPDIPLTGAACMAGPFDFYNSTLALLDAKNTTPYDRPYIPAYFMKAFQQIDKNMVDLSQAINPKFLPLGRRSNDMPPRSGSASAWIKANSVDRWVGGEFGGDQATLWMNEVLTGQPDKSVPARQILNETWVRKNLDDRNSPLSRLLKANNLIGEGSGNWTPRDNAPILLMHDQLDTTVAYSNSEQARANWFKPGEYVPMDIQDMTNQDSTKGSGHVLGAVLAIPSAFVWIANNMPSTVPSAFRAMASRKIASAAAPILGEDSADALAMAITADRAKDMPLLPVSRVAMPPLSGKETVTVSFDDWFAVFGKIKLYCVTKTKQFANQKETAPGSGLYYQLLQGGELRKVGDKLIITADMMKQTADPGSLFLAVYPGKGLVGLTPKFEGGTRGKPFKFALNIKQAFKNKVASRRVPATIKAVSGGAAWIREDAYEIANMDPAKAPAFIDLNAKSR